MRTLKKNIIGILFLAFCAWAIWYGVYQNDELIKNCTLLSGEVEEVSFTSKSADYFVTYHFNLNGKLITAKSSIPYSEFRHVLFLDSILRGKTLPIIYQTDNPNNSKMLLTRRNYEKYGVQIPSNVNDVIRQIDSLIDPTH